MSYLGFDRELDEYRKNTSPETADLMDLKDEIEDAFGLVILSDKERAELEALAKTGDEKAADRLKFALNDRELESIEEAFARSMRKETEKADDAETYLIYGGYEPLTVSLTHTLNHKAGLAWTSYSHTGVPVPTFAQGPGAESFTGYYDNTDIGKALLNLLEERSLAEAR
jgi:alkaline phosphatase